MECIGARVVLWACDQLVRQYERCDMMMALKYSVAASMFRQFRMYLKFDKLNLTVSFNLIIIGEAWREHVV